MHIKILFIFIYTTIYFNYDQNFLKNQRITLITIKYLYLNITDKLFVLINFNVKYILYKLIITY